MIHHRSIKEERNFQEEYKDAYQDYMKAEQEYKISKKNKRKSFFKIVLILFVSFCIFLFFQMGGIILNQKVEIEDGYIFYLDNDLLEFTIEKKYKQIYIPFVLSKRGEDIVYYSNQYFNQLPTYDTRKYSFGFTKYECYLKNKKVSCDHLSDLEKIELGIEEENSYERRRVSIDSFRMSIYKGDCDFEIGKVYSGKVLDNLSNYIKPGYHYCISLNEKENRYMTTEIRLSFSFIKE